MVELADAVLETTSSPGTSTTFALLGPVSARSSFGSKFSDGDVVFYYADNGIDLEYGFGAFAAGANRIARSTVLGNTQGTTSRIDFTGTTYVYNEVPASHSLWINATGGFAPSLLTGAISLVTSSSASYQSTGNMTIRSVSGLGSFNSSGAMTISSTSGLASVVGATASIGSAGASLLADTLNLTATGTKISFKTTSVGDTVAVIDASGNLLLNIGSATLTDPIGTRANGVAIRQSTSASAVSIFRETQPALDLGRGGGGTGPGYVLRFYSYVAGLTQVGGVSVDSGGAGVTYVNSSDYRIKTNIIPLTGALERLEGLIPRRFNKIGFEDRAAVDGFVAHEVSPVVPEAVVGDRDAVEVDGTPILQGVAETRLIPLLAASIKELHALVIQQGEEIRRMKDRH